MIKAIIKKILSLLDNRAFYALLITGVAFCLSIRDTVYHINDDAFMRGIAEGVLFNPKEPSEYLLFINVLYGRMLKFLYETFPDLYWYDFLFTVLLLISALVISAVMFVKNDKWTLKLITTLFLLLAYKIAFSELQFTIVSGMLACSAMLLLFYVFMQETVSKKLYIFAFVYVPFALFMSAQVRFEMMCLTVLCGGVLSLVLIKRHIFNKKLFLLCLPVAFGIILAFMANVYNYSEYAKLDMPFNPIDYNNAKSEIVDKNLSSVKEIPVLNRPDATEVLNKNGWTKNDIQLIQNWGYTGEGFFNYENMKKMAEELGPIVQGRWDERLKIFFSPEQNPSERYNHLLIFLLILCVGSRVLQAKIAAAHILFWLIFFGLAFVFKPMPFRVYFSLNFLELLFVILLSRKDFALANVADLFDKLTSFIRKKLCFYLPNSLRPTITGKSVVSRGAVVFIWFCFLSTIILEGVYYCFYDKDCRLHAELGKLELNEKGVIYLLDKDLFMASFVPYKNTGVEYENVYFPMSWMSATPTFRKKFKQDFYDLLVNKKIKFLSMRNGFYGWESLRNGPTIAFLEKHKHLKCEIVWNKRTNHGFTYYVGYYDCEKVRK